MSAIYAGWFTEVFTAAWLDLDYDEPHAVVESELELLAPPGAVHEVRMRVPSGLTQEKSQTAPGVIRGVPGSAA